MANPSIAQSRVGEHATPQAAVPRRPRLHLPIFKIIVYILLTMGAFIFALPFLWMITTSLMTPSEIAAGNYIPSGKLAGIDPVSEVDWERPLGEFLPARSELGFQGTSLTLFYNVHRDGARFDVYIDEQFLETIDSYSPTTETKSLLIDSYPSVPTLSMTQSLHLPDTNHTLKLEYNEQASQYDTIWLQSAIAMRENGEETAVEFTDLEIRVGRWEAVQFDETKQAWQTIGYFNIREGEWQTLDHIPMESFEGLQQRAVNLGFPSYLINCCQYNLIGLPGATRLHRMPQSEFIRLERPSGSHSNFTTDFVPFGLADTLGLNHRYVVTGSLSHYVTVWNNSEFSRFFINSVKIAFLTVIPQTLFAILAAYAFARMQFAGRDLIFMMFLMTLFVPFMVIIIPNLLTVTTASNWSVKNIGPILERIGEVTGKIPLLGKPSSDSARWIDRWPALAIPFWASTFSIFLLRQFFMQIPGELWDAARIDGAGHMRFLFQIVVPISKAAITTVVLFSFIGTWDQLEWPLLVTTSDNWRPISYALYEFRNQEGNDPQLLMAGALIALFPVIVVYLIAQRQFTEGIATTGLKG